MRTAKSMPRLFALFFVTFSMALSMQFVAYVKAAYATEKNTSANPEVAPAVEGEFVASAKGRIDIEGGVVRLAARRDGVIDKVLVEEGERVKAGQVMATLEVTLSQLNLELSRSEMLQAERQIEPARIRHSAAEREVQRLQSLAKDDKISRQEINRAMDELAMAQAEVESLRAGADVFMKRVALAEREIEERLVRAPLDGQVIQRQARPGNGVSTLNVTPLFLFAPDAPRIIRAELEERFIDVVKPGQRAEIVLEANPTRRWQSHVLRIGKVVGQRTPSDDPAERQDNRIVECVLSAEAMDLLIGQRVIVRFAADR